MVAKPGTVRERAPAKVNLYLHLCGRRADGYHLLESLAVFPNVGDVLHAAHADTLSLTICGPCAEGLSAGEDNLVLQAARSLARVRGNNTGAALHLDKHLPVASGIGGGSSDAAAALRALCRLWDCTAPEDLALSLGADVPVCLEASRPTLMQGIGDRLSPVPVLPAMAIVLVNPREEVPTGAVFAGVEDRNPPPGLGIPVSGFASFGGFADWLRQQRNDLQTSAERICPTISRVLSGLSEAPVARMSGSGATCFGLFPDLDQAEHAAKSIQHAYPNWWVVAADVPGH